MNETLTNITIKLPAEDWKRMAELYGKNRAWKVRLAIKELIKKAESQNPDKFDNQKKADIR